MRINSDELPTYQALNQNHPFWNYHLHESSYWPTPISDSKKWLRRFNDFYRHGTDALVLLDEQGNLININIQGALLPTLADVSSIHLMAGKQLGTFLNQKDLRSLSTTDKTNYQVYAQVEHPQPLTTYPDKFISINMQTPKGTIEAIRHPQNNTKHEAHYGGLYLSLIHI